MICPQTMTVGGVDPDVVVGRPLPGARRHRMRRNVNHSEWENRRTTPLSNDGDNADPRTEDHPPGFPAPKPCSVPTPRPSSLSFPRPQTGATSISPTGRPVRWASGFNSGGRVIDLSRSRSRIGIRLLTWLGFSGTRSRWPAPRPNDDD